MPHALPVDAVSAHSGSMQNVGWMSREAASCWIGMGPTGSSRNRRSPHGGGSSDQFRALVIWILIAAADHRGRARRVGRHAGDPGHRAAQRRPRLPPGGAGRAGRWPRCGGSRPRWPRSVRDGRLQAVPARELVPGDRIELEAGDSVPADARLIRAFGLRVQEAALTGESVARGQGPGLRPRPAHAAGRPPQHGLHGHGRRRRQGATPWSSPPAWRPNWAGSPACSSRPSRSRRRCSGGWPSWAGCWSSVCLAVVAVIFALQLLRGERDHRVFLLAVSLAVAAVPEGLPAVVTAGPGPRPPAHGAAQCPGPQAAERRDAGLGDGHLLGQDRHLDPQRDDGARDRRRAAAGTGSPGRATPPAGSSSDAPRRRGGDAEAHRADDGRKPVEI